MKQTLLLLSTAALLVSVTSCQSEKDSPEPTSQPAACALVPDTGPCNAAFQRYYFDPVEKKCKPFVWGGCGGVVPFLTLQECKDCGCK